MSISLIKGPSPAGKLTAASAASAKAGGQEMFDADLVLREVTDPFRLFQVGLEAAETDILEGTEFSAWRYFVSEADGKVLIHDVVEVDGDMHLAASARPPYLDEVIEELEWLLDQAQFEQGDYELCYLEILGIPVEAWWLRPGDPKESWFLPVPPTVSRVRRTRHDLLDLPRFSERVAEVAFPRRIRDEGLLSDVLKEALEITGNADTPSTAEDDS